MTKHEKQLLALIRAGKNPTYRAKIKAKIKNIKASQSWYKYLSK